MFTHHNSVITFLVRCCLCVACRVYADEGIGTVYIPNAIDDPTLYVVPLSRLDGSGFLRGEAADVTNGFQDIERAWSKMLEFDYNPEVPGEERVHFAETMVYYHITAFDEYVGSLGFDSPTSSIQTVVFDHIPLTVLCIPVATQYSPDTGVISLSSTVECDQSDALDGDLIVHEYAHAIQHRLLGGVLGQFVSLETHAAEQALPLMEGLADFAAASYFGDSQLGEWSASIWFDCPFMRDVDNFRRWPDDLAEGGAHTTGLIFSGALWDLRSKVGAAVADRLWLQMMSSISDNDPGTPELNTTFADASEVLLEGDTDLHGGIHQERARQAFAVHGIGEYDFSTPFPMVRNPGNDYDGLEVYNDPGAVALAVAFDEFVTKLDNSPYTTDEHPRPGIDEKGTVDRLSILDGSDTVIGTFTGRELQGATVVVPGDTVKLHLVTDSFLAPFGYRVVKISAVDAGDFDGNGDVSLSDVAEFQSCLTGPGGGIMLGRCVIGDFDGDVDVDLADFSEFQPAFGLR